MPSQVFPSDILSGHSSLDFKKWIFCVIRVNIVRIASLESVIYGFDFEESLLNTVIISFYIFQVLLGRAIDLMRLSSVGVFHF